MEIIAAIATVIIACAIEPPSWWQIIVYALFILVSIVIGSVDIANKLFRLRENINKKEDGNNSKKKRK